ncbi:MAG: methyltransferase [Candidatus Eremiobacteraeota bacterium]|nr:methyltransferase [Candidatus Eremiobacteraeota bacterium]
MEIGGWYKEPEPAKMFASMLPRPLPDDRQTSILTALPKRLEEAGYDEKNLEQFLSGLPLIYRRYEQTPGYLWHCRQRPSAAADLACLWLFRQPLARQKAEAAMGAEVVQELLALQLLEADQDEVRALADLYPCMGRCFFTDPKWSVYKRFPNHVYDVSGDSFGLAFLATRKPVGRALDLGLGSGIHAILAAGHAEAVVGVDINPRAIGFTRLNAAVNGVADRCDFRQGSLLGPVEGERFDQMSANLPFVPTPSDETLELYRPGGETGEELVEEVISKAGQFLNPGGTFFLVTTYPVMRSSHYLERIVGWLGGNRGWGVGLLNYGESPREMYIENQIDDFGGHRTTPEFIARFQNWADCYEKHGIDAIREGVIAIRRLPEDHPGFAEERSLPLPENSKAKLVGEWLKAMTRFHQAWTPEWHAWEPALHPLAPRLWEDLGGQVGKAEYPTGWWPSAELDQLELDLIKRLGPGKEAARLATEWAGEQGLSEEDGRRWVSDGLRSLGQKMIVA